jgi:hypothetical protein
MQDSYFPSSHIPVAHGFTITHAEHKHGDGDDHTALVIREGDVYRLRCWICELESERFTIRRTPDKSD